MGIKKAFLFLLLCLLAGPWVQAQEKRHVVQKGETMYSLSKRYNVTVDAIQRANPEVAKGLKTGMELLIPAPKPAEPAVTPGRTREVKAGETMYGICKEEGISQEDLKKLNPQLAEGLKVGMVLNLPGKASNPAPSQRLTAVLAQSREVPAADTATWKLVEVLDGQTLDSLMATYGVTREVLLQKNPELEEGVEAGKFIIVPEKPMKAAGEQWFTSNKKDSLKVVLLLPIQSAKSDSALRSGGNWTGGLESKIGLEFMHGFLMGADSLAKRGIHTDIRVVEFNKGSKNVAWLNDKEGVDVVFGPFYGTDIQRLSSTASKNDLLMVSPFARNVDLSSRYLVDMYANPDNSWEAIAQHLKQQPGRDTILLVSAKGGDAEALKKVKANLGRIYVEHVFDPAALQRMGGAKITIPAHIKHVVLVEENEARATRMIQAIYKAGQGKVTMYGSPKLAQERVFDKDMLNALHFTFPSVFWPDYQSGAVRSFVSTYQERVHADPSKYAFTGFDAALCVLLSYAEKGAFWGWNGVPVYRGLGTDILWSIKRNVGFRMVRIEDYSGVVVAPLEE